METVVIKKYFKLLILTTLIFSSCSGNDEGDDTENQPPSEFLVEVTSVLETSAIINWSLSEDPEGSTVFYDVYLDEVKLIDNITELTFAFEDLTPNTSYSGEVVASDPEGNTQTSSFNFETTNNQPPTSFNVSVTSTNPFYPQLEWTESLDPEGGNISYNIYLDDLMVAEGINNLNYSLPVLKGLTDYSGFVEAVDEQGKTTEATFTFATLIKIYDGDLLLENQSMVASFGEDGYNEIDGSLNIGTLQENSTDITDLSALQSITVVNGNISIRHTMCTDFAGLENIDTTYAFAKLTIENNDQLINCNGLNSITSLNMVYIADNDELTSLEGLTSLHTITNYLWIVLNPNLSSLSGLQNLQTISFNLDIVNNNSLTSLLGLENITSLNELDVVDNDSLESLNGLNNLVSCSSSLNIADNPLLQNLNGLSSVSSVISLHITDNPLLSNLNGLENLTDVNHTLQISRNSGLVSLDGIQNVVFSDNQANYHVITIWENENITNLDPLANYTYNRGLINIKLNTQLTDLCGLTTIISEIEDFINDYNFATNNGYNPSEMDILNGNCSL